MGVSIHLEGTGAAVDEMLRRVLSFAADLREQGIHVGMGTSPRCVTCDEPWPCAESVHLEGRGG